MARNAVLTFPRRYCGSSIGGRGALMKPDSWRAREAIERGSREQKTSAQRSLRDLMSFFISRAQRFSESRCLAYANWNVGRPVR